MTKKLTLRLILDFVSSEEELNLFLKGVFTLVTRGRFLVVGVKVVH